MANHNTPASSCASFTAASAYSIKSTFSLNTAEGGNSGINNNYATLASKSPASFTRVRKAFYGFMPQRQYEHPRLHRVGPIYASASGIAAPGELNPDQNNSYS